MTKVHYPQCSKYPVACPNECREDKFERQELESHLQDQCPLTLVDCPFNYAGCQTQLPRKDMPEHMRETVTHLTLLASVTHSHRQLQQSMRVKDQLCRDKQRAIKQEVQTLVKKVHELELQLSGFPVDFWIEQNNDDVYFTPIHMAIEC